MKQTWIIDDIETEIRIFCESKTRKENCLVFFPGNPGIADWYDEFLGTIHSHCDKNVDIIAVSYPGHAPAIPVLLSLEEQIRHKIQTLEYIESIYPDGTKFFLAGHSLGSYVALNVLKAKENMNIVKMFGLFPSMQNMADTPRAAEVRFDLIQGPTTPLPLDNQFACWHCLDLALDIAISNTLHASTPTPMAHVTTKKLINPSVIRAVLTLARSEFEGIQDLDEEFISKNQNKFLFYYGYNDGWAPPIHYQSMKEFSEVDVHMCDEGISHAFITWHSKSMGIKMAAWLKPLL